MHCIHICCQSAELISSVVRMVRKMISNFTAFYEAQIYSFYTGCESPKAKKSLQLFLNLNEMFVYRVFLHYLLLVSSQNNREKFQNFFGIKKY